MKPKDCVLFAALAVVSIPFSMAQAGMSYGTDEGALISWERMVSLESCMNGDVSASGLYPSQIAEDKSFATLGRLAGLSSRQADTALALPSGDCSASRATGFGENGFAENLCDD